MLRTCTLLIAACAVWSAEESPSWHAFVQRGADPSADILPDYSFAGYARGEREPVAAGKQFDVTAYGAHPDDLEDDRAGIAAAVQAAQAAGGGVVYLPKGRYLVNSTMAGRGMIPITASGVVVRGAGCGADGTIIHCIQPFDRGDDPHDPARLHLGDTLFTAIAPSTVGGVDQFPELAKVTGVATRGSCEVDLDDVSHLAPGDWVVLWVRNQDVLRGMIAPFEIEPTWTSITENKARLAEIHQVKEIRGKTLVCAEPIRYPVRGDTGWVVRKFQPISEIGFEDLCFLGNAHQRYAHHRSDIDDSGWSSIKLLGVTNGWVRRCAFVDSSQAVAVSLSAFVSLLNVVIDGNQGHHGLRSVFFNYGVLGGLSLDRSGCTHGPSVSMGAVGTVYWRCGLMPDQPLDFHSGKPFCSLFDACGGGVLYGSSGGLRDFPQHLRDLTVWNLDHRAGLSAEKSASPAPHYDFWREGQSDRFVMPVIVGLHGAPATFATEHLARLESLGTAVAPGSLYQAQLALRLGGEPAWIARAEAEHAALIATTLTPHFTFARPHDGLLVPETFRCDDLLRFLVTRSLEVNQSRSFAWTPAAPELTLHADQSAVRDALYALMCGIYHCTRDGNRIAVSAEGNDVVFRLQSGATKHGDLTTAREVADARIFAGLIAATVTVQREGDHWLAELRIPGR
jgi:hypothetical protein